jgi:hypothetical protein
MTCRKCGATVIVDVDRGDEIHRRWHDHDAALAGVREEK